MPGDVNLDSRWTGVFEFKFGKSFALRDLYELEGDRAPVDLGFLLIEAPVLINGATYHWVAAINLGVFLNLLGSTRATCGLADPPRWRTGSTLCLAGRTDPGPARCLAETARATG
jgi:hypothetical protein